jgi:hypothetical protein
MKIFFTSILIFIALIKLSAQSFNHDLNWKEFFYNTNPAKAKNYDVRFYPKQLPDDYLVKFTGFTWEEVLADTMENFLKTVKLTDFLPEYVVYTTGGVPILLVSMVPFKLEEGKYFYLKNFSIEIIEEVEIKKNLDRKFVDVSVLSSGNWIKMSSKERGIHKLTYARLKELGISDPSSLSVYTNGGFMLPKMNKDEYPDDIVKVPVYHTKDKNGNDAAFFYSPGTVQWDYNQVKKFFNHSINLYSDSAYFFMTSDLSPSNSPEVKKQTTTFADTTITTYLAYHYHEEELNNLINSGRYWLGEVINDKGRRSFTRNFSDVVPSQNATLRVVTAARSFSPSRMFVRINGELIDTLSYTAVSRGEYADYFRYNDKNYSLPANENISIELSYDSQGAGGDSWLDYITWNVPVSLKFSANQLSFRSSEAAKYPVVKFEIQNSLGNCQLWDVTDFLNPHSVPFVVNELNKNISVVDSGGVIREYVIFDPVNGNLHEPSFSSKVANQNIHGDKQPYEMIIVTHPSFLAQSEKLADFHRKSDGMNVLVLTTHSIYNEFSSGLPDISGIRNMLRMFYDRQLNTENPLKYLLLMGDGSYDNRNFDGKKNNFIPTYQSIASVSKGDSYVTDDFYGLLDDDEGESEGYLDIGIGRIPCKTAIEAEIVIAKVIDYSSGKSLGNWRNNICFISDDEDNNTYMDDAEKLISLINNNDPGFYFKKIYLDAYPQISTAQGHRYPAVTEAINQAVSDGALILNYIGHANPLTLAAENVLGINDIQNWKNNKALPLFITANCEYGRYDDDKNSAGEEILLNPSGGGIALFTTTRAVYAGNNQNLSMNFYTNIFKHDKKGEKLRLGDVMKNSKNLTRDTNKFSFSLLADPALRLAFPKYKIKTTSINGINPEQDTVTMGSLDKITITGQVVDSDDNTMTGFNGEISTTIYDKEIFLETLANDGGRPFKYSVQSNVIYRENHPSKRVNSSFLLLCPKTFLTVLAKDVFYIMPTTELPMGTDR